MKPKKTIVLRVGSRDEGRRNKYGRRNMGEIAVELRGRESELVSTGTHSYKQMGGWRTYLQQVRPIKARNSCSSSLGAVWFGVKKVRYCTEMAGKTHMA